MTGSLIDGGGMAPGSKGPSGCVGASGLSSAAASGGAPPAYTPSLDFSDARNSQYFFLLFVW